MGTEIQLFNNPEFGNVRVIGDSGNPRFCLSDVCKVLELQAAAVMRRLESSVTSSHPVDTGYGVKDMTFVNEDGLYDVILDSRKPCAKKFRKWITSEVIPSIRKTGVYMTAQAAEKILMNPDFIIKLAEQVKLAQKERDEFKALAAAKDEESQDLKPDAEYARRILQSKETLLVSLIAKDYGLSAVTFNLMLLKYKIQHRVGNAWVINEPYSKMGYTKSETVELKNGMTKTQTRWTQKGRMWLYSELKKHSVIPVCERENKMATLL